jgi:hypothetical protein
MHPPEEFLKHADSGVATCRGFIFYALLIALSPRPVLSRRDHLISARACMQRCMRGSAARYGEKSRRA